MAQQKTAAPVIPAGPMLPPQALQILHNATAGLQLGRSDHLLILEALRVLQEAVTPVLPEKAKQEVPAPKGDKK